MKKLLLALLVTGSVSNAQQYGTKWNQRNKEYHGFITSGIDVRNAIVGSKPTNNQSALDIQFKVGARANSLEVALFYETFRRIDFQAYGVNVNGVFQLYKNFDVALGVGGGSVIRYKDYNFLMVETNSEIRYDLSKCIIGFQLNNRLRNDLKQYGKSMPIVNSVFLNFTYKL